MRFPIVTGNIKVSSTKVYQSKLKIVYDTADATGVLKLIQNKVTQYIY